MQPAICRGFATRQALLPQRAIAVAKINQDVLTVRRNAQKHRFLRPIMTRFPGKSSNRIRKRVSVDRPACVFVEHPRE